jgi:tetratricopeptide (TPR) repeat protein
MLLRAVSPPPAIYRKPRHANSVCRRPLWHCASARASVARIMRQPTQPGPIEQTLQRAAFAMQNGQAAEAERLAKDIMKKSPGDPRAAQILGYALIMQGRGQDAIAPLERALQLGPNPMLETQLGMALKQAGRKDEALKRLESAVSRQPPFPPAFLEYGTLLIDQTRNDQAVAVLERGLSLAPNFADMALRLGQAFARLGQREKASQAFARVLANIPRDLDALFNAARVMQDSGDFAQAADLFKRMLAINANEAGARIGLGVCQMELGQAEAAFDNLSEASQRDDKMYGETLTALVNAGRGRFWLKTADAARALKRNKS